MDLVNLFPEYPNITSDTFYIDLYNKKEFNDLQFEPEEELGIKKFYKHQLLISRFISNWTLYQSLILIHDTGTGKSGAAAAVFDGLKKFNNNLLTLYITNNDNLLENFKDEIFRLSHILYDPFVEQINMNLEESKRIYLHKRNSILSKAGIHFTTYYKFASDYLKQKKNKDFIKKWENQLIIMDEVHHLISQEVEKPKQERTLKKKISISPNVSSSIINTLIDFESISKNNFSNIKIKSFKDELLKLNQPSYFQIIDTSFKILKNIIKESPKTIPNSLNNNIILLENIINLINKKTELELIEETKSNEILYNKLIELKNKNIIEIISTIAKYLRKMAYELNSSLKPYDEIFEFVHELNFKKMILLTATPMRNSPSEIAPLINLVLDKKNQIKIGESFINNYFVSQKTNSTIPLLNWKSTKKQDFINIIKGYISVVKIKVNVNKIYEGKIYQPMKYFKIFANEMEDIQMEGYKIALESDTKKITQISNKKQNETSFYNNCQQASLFVYPDLSFGIKKTNPYLDANNRFNSTFNKETGLKFFTKKTISNIDENDQILLHNNLEIVKKMSITYYNIIKQIIENRNKKIYVYCDKIMGSGIKLCISLLNQYFGYSQLQSIKKLKDIDKSPKCIFLHETEKETSKSDIPLLIKEAFNNPNNINGEYVQVIFGTDKTREGISLKAVQQIHICSGDWNFGKIFQAMGRGIRLNSHIGLPPDTNVQIFLHCAVPQKNKIKVEISQEESAKSFIKSKDFKDKIKTNDEFDSQQLNQSIDFFRYYRSELKDLNIKKIEYALLISAVDCQVNKSHNINIKNINNSTECLYENCQYSCEGFKLLTQQEISSLPIDYSTYNLYYIQDFLKKTIEFIKNIFYKKTLYDLKTILKLAKEQNIADKSILETLSTIIETPILIPFYDGRNLYLNQYNDNFYLSQDCLEQEFINDKQLWISDYSKVPTFKINTSFDHLLENLKEFNFQKLCKSLYDYYLNNNKIEAINIINMFSDKYFFQFMKTLIKQNNPNPLIVWLKIILKNILILKKNKWFLNKNNTIYLYDVKLDNWILEKQEIIQSPKQDKTTTQNHDSEEFKLKYIKDKKVYGFIDNNKFKIRDVSNSQNWTNKKTMTSGKVCSSFDFHKLIYFLFSINPNLPEPKDMNETMLSIFKKLNNKNTEMLKKESLQLVSGYKDFLESIKKTKDSISREELIFLLFYYKSFDNKKKDFCEYLLNSFKDNNILVKPPIKK